MTAKPIQRVLQVHNRYVWSPGGEISVLESEAELLRNQGIHVDQFFVDNPEEISGLGNKIKAAKNVIWSTESLERVRQAIRQSKPDIVHVHNFFIHLSPSVYKACNLEGVPVVQTLHNFRTCCAAANLLRDNRACQDCVGRFPLPALKHKCYRGSLAATVPLVLMQQVNRWNGAFTKMCDGYIALSEFAKEIFARSGLPESKIYVKGHSTVDPGDKPLTRENTVVFLGRFTDEKGPEVVVKAWVNAMPPGWKLLMFGAGPLEQSIKEIAKSDPSIEFPGWADPTDIPDLLRQTKFTINSSHCYETFGLSLIEAMAVGNIPIVPDHGQMPEIVDSPKIGLAFQPSDDKHLRQVILNAVTMSQSEYDQRSSAARNRYLKHYTPEKNYQNLLAIYKAVLANYTR
jgi:glycosyltransferase involved in cell wall biosynthesis